MTDETKQGGVVFADARFLPTEADLVGVHAQIDDAFDDPDAPIPYRLNGAVLAPLEGSDRP